MSQLIPSCILFKSWQSAGLNEPMTFHSIILYRHSAAISHNPHSPSRLYDLHLYWREKCIDWCSGRGSSSCIQSDKVTYWIFWAPFGLPNQAETRQLFRFCVSHFCSDEDPEVFVKIGVDDNDQSIAAKRRFHGGQYWKVFKHCYWHSKRRLYLWHPKLNNRSIISFL